MIIEISSSLESFKTIHFHCGINVLLADSREPTKEGLTRNSSGKTSLIEIIHFLLGASLKDGKLYSSPALEGVRFFATFQLKGDLWRISREVGDGTKMYFHSGNPDRYGLDVREDPKTGALWLPVSVWKDLLGHTYFDLPLPRKGTIYDLTRAPSFRSLLGYFCRRHLEGGFAKPTYYSTRQADDDARIALSYLLRLDWQLAREFSVLADRKKLLRTVKTVTKDDLFSKVIGKPAELRSLLATAQARSGQLRRDVTSFRVVEAYKEKTAQAARLRQSLQKLSVRESVLKDSLELLEQSFQSEAPPAQHDVKAMYEAAGIQLPGISLRRFEEVAAFHNSIVSNRRNYLRHEMTRVGSELDRVHREMEAASHERAQILSSLAGAGALDDFTEMQRHLGEAEARSSMLNEQLKAAVYLESEETDIKLRQVQLQQRLQQDLTERQEIVAEAQALIADLGREVYADRDVALTVDAAESGPVFDVSIPGDHGGGIHNVEIFLFDLMMFILASRHLGKQRFLVHDSHLFDGIDERQTAKCLMLAERAAFEEKGQYIVTMNSDVFGKLPRHFWPDGDKYVLEPRLTDEPGGGLFGMRFEA